MPVEIRRVETVYRGYVTLMVATLAMEDGSTFTREIEDHGRAVAVLPYDPLRRCALMVRLPRAPAAWADGPPELTEAPAGMVEDETAEATARREALEEAGVRLGALEPVASPFASPGVSTERIQLFLAPYAAADRVAPGGGHAHEHEHITVVEAGLDELWRRVEADDILDMKTLVLLLALRLRRPELFEA
ncbi:MAG TPA: NUDIX hydrolase [Phenylobacterium sp.]|uniref:NUDIX hydrolase n=1 Tax=Phenylobacterium sp. TaxID=1871053 RepID=UPI002C57C24B|nr:NUDIX hydrolase [Phenylobacterium sp.]HSV03656.1 NUDIX hydrolase [Phenylobacterium sp.]